MPMPPIARTLVQIGAETWILRMILSFPRERLAGLPHVVYVRLYYQIEPIDSSIDLEHVICG